MRQKLLDAGYVQYATNEVLDKYVLRMYQKCERDDNGNKLFFITVEEYPPHSHLVGCKNPFEAYGQFELNSGQTVDLRMHHGWTIEQMESFFRKFFTDMDCKPYYR